MPEYRYSRRWFIRWLWLSGLSAFLAGCRTEVASTVDSPSLTPSPTSTITPLPSPTPTSTLTPTHTPVPYTSLVALGRANNYDPGLLRAELERMFNTIGGLDILFKPGLRIGIKTNLTGESWWNQQPPAEEYFVTHPGVIGALGRILRDLGAGKIYIVDGLGDEANFAKWGYVDMAAGIGAELVDLCKPAPYKDFIRIPVGDGANIYDHFTVNPILNEVDLFISVAKMKCHSTTGVTLSMKNLVGLVPISLYRENEGQNYRALLHGSYAFDERLPRVVLDLMRARPIHFAVVDGIRTAEGGAGPWDKGLSPVQPGILAAGVDPVAVDSVCTAVMGFDPETPSGQPPFVGGENHIALACKQKLGTNKLASIRVTGLAIQEVLYPFKPTG